MKNILLFLCTIGFLNICVAQQTPAEPQTQKIVIMGATAHLGNGEVIENSVIAFDNGKFTTIANQAIGQGFDGFKVINAEGKHIYPGLIAPNTQLGLTEIGAVRATRDNYEIGQFNPNLRAIVAYNTDSKVTPTIRSNGILLAQITPQGGRMPGQSSIVELDAWNWEDAAYKTDESLYLRWPNAFSRSGWWSAEPGIVSKNKKYAEQVLEIENLLKEAQAYAQTSNPKTINLKFEAMRGLFDGSKQLFIDADFSKSITESVLVAKKYGITPVVLSGKDAWLVAKFLKKNNVPVILHETQSLPGTADTDIDQPFKSAIQLHEAGVLFCFSMEGYYTQRNLPFQAGQAVGFGLDKEVALQALTGNTAKILGIDKTVGTLEEGKDATFIVSEGDILDMRTNKIIHGFIRGKEIDLDNKQKALYRKFSKKYQSRK